MHGRERGDRMLLFTVAAAVALFSTFDSLVANGLQQEAENPLRVREDAIKANAILDLAHANTSRLQVVAELSNSTALLPAPIDVAPTEVGHLVVLENNLSRLYAAQFSDPNQTSFIEINPALSLEYPNVIKRLQDVLYISDDNGIQVINIRGRSLRTVHSFYGVNDFVPVGDTILINPRFATGESPPLVVSIDKTGKKTSSWGRQDISSQAGLNGAVRLAACGPTIFMAAMEHQPVIYIFRDQKSEASEAHIGFPGSDQLRALSVDPALTNPRPHFYSLPTFYTGASCDRDSFYFLLDLPVPCIYQLDGAGHTLRVFLADTQEASGRHFSRLAVLRSGNVIYFYTIAEDRDGTKKVVVLRAKTS